MDKITDSDRIDWLERMANQRGGLLLHDGSEQGRTGLGLRPGCLVRTLREAIDCCLRSELGIAPPRSLEDVAFTALPSEGA